MSVFDLDRIGGVRGLHGLVDAIVEAGDRAAVIGRDLGEVERKGDASPVTIADRQTEERLRAYAAERFPGIPFLGEETTAATGDPVAPGREGLRFVVDPIDGTRAFVRGIPTWSVLVGIEDGPIPVVGIAYMPAAGHLFVGVRGGGATGDGRPLSVSSVSDLAASAAGHGALSQFTDAGQGATLTRLAEATDTQRGFADFESYRHLLEGRLDLVVDPGVAPWDVCAVAVLVHEAGGQTSDLAGHDGIYGGSFLATNGRLHDAALAALADG